MLYFEHSAMSKFLTRFTAIALVSSLLVEPSSASGHSSLTSAGGHVIDMSCVIHFQQDAFAVRALWLRQSLAKKVSAVTHRLWRWTRISDDWTSLQSPFHRWDWFWSLGDMTHSDLSIGLLKAQASLFQAISEIVFLVILTPPGNSSPHRTDEPTTLSQLVVFAPVAVLLAPLLEECFRALITIGIQATVRKITWTSEKKAFAWGAGIATVAWAAPHWFVIDHFTVGFGITFFSVLLAFGLSNSWLFWRTNQLKTSVIAHAMFNLSLCLGAFLIILFGGDPITLWPAVGLLIGAPVVFCLPLITWFAHRLLRQDLPPLSPQSA